MEILKTEYQIEKDKKLAGIEFDSYTITKTIVYDNEKKETRSIIFVPLRDGDINTVDLDKLYFPKAITQEEWKRLSPEYRKAWLNGKMTKELFEERENLVKEMEGCVV